MNKTVASGHSRHFFFPLTREAQQSRSFAQSVPKRLQSKDPKVRREVLEEMTTLFSTGSEGDRMRYAQQFISIKDIKEQLRQHSRDVAFNESVLKMLDSLAKLPGAEGFVSNVINGYDIFLEHNPKLTLLHLSVLESLAASPACSGLGIHDVKFYNKLLKIYAHQDDLRKNKENRIENAIIRLLALSFGREELSLRTEYDEHLFCKSVDPRSVFGVIKRILSSKELDGTATKVAAQFLVVILMDPTSANFSQESLHPRQFSDNLQECLITGVTSCNTSISKAAIQAIKKSAHSSNVDDRLVSTLLSVLVPSQFLLAAQVVPMNRWSPANLQMLFAHLEGQLVRGGPAPKKSFLSMFTRTKSSEETQIINILKEQGVTDVDAERYPCLATIMGSVE